jgi:uncharacterized protein YutE (UPF0331/DUF86 family)
MYMTDRDHLYEQEQQQHITKMMRILDAYQVKNNLTETDMLAIERGLQVLVESLIGFSRYVADIFLGIKVSKSREAIDVLKRNGIINSDEHKMLQSMVGCRNVLVHDYLNVDETIIQAIIMKKEYAYIAKIFAKIQGVL